MKLSMAVAGVVFIALSTVAVASPSQAALIDFNFTTLNGGTGTFTLDTETLSSSDPALFRPGIPGISYAGAVSNLSFSSSYLNLSNATADFNIAPSFTSEFIGFPANQGVLGGVSYPDGCITQPGFPCFFNVALLYSGNLLELPELSDNPLSYSRGLGIEYFEPTTLELLLRDDITNFQVIRKQSVPESNSSLSLLAFGIANVALLLKHNMSKMKFLLYSGNLSQLPPNIVLRK